MTGARTIAAVRAGWGAALLAFPSTELDLEEVLPARRTRPKRIVLRILGARYLTQAGIEALRPHPAVLTGAALVDLVHAAVDLVLARCDRDWRRAATGDAVIALAFAVALTVALRREERSVGSR